MVGEELKALPRLLRASEEYVSKSTPEDLFPSDMYPDDAPSGYPHYEDDRLDGTLFPAFLTRRGLKESG
jgi:hypothetical protein